MTAQGSGSRPQAWRLAGTIALASVALVCREAIRFLDDQSWRVRDRIVGGSRGVEPSPGAPLGDR